MKCVGVLLCYNDGDLLADAIAYLREQNHDIIAWDHGSTDNTPDIINRHRSEFVEAARIPREHDFYDLYPAMSRHLLNNYVHRYDWISWPDQDEFLEGPNRRRSFHDSLLEVYESEYNWIQFRNLNYWFTAADDSAITHAPQRIRHYSLFPDCAPRIRSWRAASTNIRIFNHNDPIGCRWPVDFNLRHYPMRSEEQMLARLERDRKGLRRGDANFHYDNMARWRERLVIDPSALHYDDGRCELNLSPVFDWRQVYGYASSAVTPT